MLDLPHLLGVILSIKFGHDLLMWRLPTASFLCAFYLAFCYLFYQAFSSMPRLEWLVRDLCGIPMVMDLSKRRHAVASFEPEGYRSHFVCFSAVVLAKMSCGRQEFLYDRFRVGVDFLTSRNPSAPAI